MGGGSSPLTMKLTLSCTMRLSAKSGLVWIALVVDDHYLMGIFLSPTFTLPSLLMSSTAA